MGTTVKAYGNFSFDNLPGFGLGAGVRSMFGTLIPPGARVTYVRSTGTQDGDPAELNGRILPTLAAGLAGCRSGLNDWVLVLPGHSESVVDATMLDNLAPGTNILGLGKGSNMPVFRWTATGSQWVINDADVMIAGLRLRMEGANGVVKAVAVTAADVRITDCDVELASGAALKATIGIEAGAGATRFSFDNNKVRGTATHNVTDGVLVAAAVDGVNISDNFMMASATAANGLVRFSAAATGIRFSNNTIINTMTSSVVAAALGSAAVTGSVERNLLGHEAVATITSGTNGVSFSGTVAVRFFDNWICDAAGGAIGSIPTAVT